MALDSPLDTLGKWLDAVEPGAEGVATIERFGRLVDAARVRVASAIDAEAAAAPGFASPAAAVATLARVSEKSARVRVSVAEATRVDRTLTGAEVPALLPALASALAVVGPDAAELITRELSAVRGRVDPGLLAATEQVMVNIASGRDAAGARPVAPESVTALSGQFSQIASAIDPDGAAPREERARKRRMFRLGRQDSDGLVPATGLLLPEIASLLLGLIEAHRRTPRFTEEPEFAHLEAADTRTPDQRRHDAVADVILAAARSANAPTLDGTPVTVVVTTTLDALADENGRAGDPIGTMTGSRTPVSRAVVERFIDGTGFRVARLKPDGSAAGLSSPQRCFSPLQRMTIATRDGYRCATPGCTSPHYALQVHHVVAWRDRGQTHVDNGILLCYWHHQQVDTGPWQFRMTHGLPEVRGPGVPEWSRVGAPARAAT